jgi:high-affinity iron transporter
MILNWSIALSGALLAVPALAQDTPGQRLAAVLAVAVEEYRLGVDARGNIVSQTELAEAREAMLDAKDVARRMSGGNTRALTALVDSLASAMLRPAATGSIDSLYTRLNGTLGADAVLDPPSRHFDLAAGKALYQQNCLSCHGPSGFGDGPAAKAVVGPPPAALAGPGAHPVAAGLEFRVVSAGVKGTAMVAWGDKLTADQRWDVVAYVNSLRAAGSHAGLGAANQRIAHDADASARQYLESALQAARDSRTSEAIDRALDSYAAFEPMESLVRAHDAPLVSRLENHFLEFRGAIRAGDMPRAVRARDSILAGLPRAVDVASSTGGAWQTFVPSLVIVVREGFEVILILGAIVAMLLRTGNHARVKEVRLGALLALAASGVTAVILKTVLKALHAPGDVIEGATMLVAVVVLFFVSYWILSKVESDRWQAFIRGKVDSAVHGGGRATLVGVAFLVVYREGAETVLFYQALLQQGSATVPYVLAGLVLGSLVLAGIYFGFKKFGVRVPLRPFFAATGVLLYLMAFVFIGQGVRELQEAGVVPDTALAGAPHLDLLGIYPSVQTLMGQGLLLGLFGFACWRSFATPRLAARRKSRDDRDPPSGGSASTTSQTRRTRPRSSAPS